MRLRRATPKLSGEVRERLAEPLSSEQQRELGKTTVFDLVACVHCGGLHLRACPRVKRMRFRPQPGQRIELIEVEFWPDGEWSDLGVIWPEDVFDGAVNLPTTSSEPEGA